MFTKALGTAIVSAALAFPLAGCDVQTEEDVTPVAPGVQTTDPDDDTGTDVDINTGTDTGLDTGTGLDSGTATGTGTDVEVDTSTDTDSGELLGDEEVVE